MVCFGSVAVKAAFPELPDEADNDVREDGTAAHWLANEIWNGRFPAVDSMSPNQRVLDAYMFDYVDEYHGVLRSHGVPMQCEQSLKLDVIHPGMTGTPDAWGWDDKKLILYVDDFKYGFRFVEVWYNWQLICYAAALLEKLGINGQTDQYTTVVFTIHQPRSPHRSGPIRTWTVRASDLRPYINQLRHAAEMAMRDEWPDCTPNPGCPDCAGRHACEALHNSALTALETSYGGSPLEMDAPAVGNELRMLMTAQKRLEARVTGLQVQAESMIRAGKIVPHFTLAATFAREKWREGTESHVMSLGLLYGANLAQPVKAISPAQARKLIPSTLVAQFAHKPSTGVSLQKQDPLEAAKAFSSTQE